MEKMDSKTLETWRRHVSQVQARSLAPLDSGIPLPLLDGGVDKHRIGLECIAAWA